MKLTDLQERVLDRAAELRDASSNEAIRAMPLCLDYFKPDSELGYDSKIEDIGLEKAAQKIFDDSLYWEGLF